MQTYLRKVSWNRIGIRGSGSSRSHCFKRLPTSKAETVSFCEVSTKKVSASSISTRKFRCRPAEPALRNRPSVSKWPLRNFKMATKKCGTWRSAWASPELITREEGAKSRRGLPKTFCFEEGVCAWADFLPGVAGKWRVLDLLVREAATPSSLSRSLERPWRPRRLSGSLDRLEQCFILVSSLFLSSLVRHSKSCYLLCSLLCLKFCNFIGRNTRRWLAELSSRPWNLFKNHS